MIARARQRERLVRCVVGIKAYSFQTYTHTATACHSVAFTLIPRRHSYIQPASPDLYRCQEHRHDAHTPTPRTHTPDHPDPYRPIGTRYPPYRRASRHAKPPNPGILSVPIVPTLGAWVILYFTLFLINIRRVGYISFLFKSKRLPRGYND